MVAEHNYFFITTLINFSAGAVIFRNKGASVNTKSVQFSAHDKIKREESEKLLKKNLTLYDMIALNSGNATYISNLFRPPVNYIIPTFPYETESDNAVFEKSHSNNYVSEPAWQHFEQHKATTLNKLTRQSSDHHPTKRKISSKKLIADEKGIKLSTVVPVVPVCNVSDGDCERCKNVSRYCHYMYSERRCVFYHSVHASQLYECGERWFPIDKNELFFTSVVILLLISAIAAGYLIWLRTHLVFREAFIPPDQYEELRRAIDIIREKRLRTNTENNVESGPQD